jgi:aryl-alcohol dehydrogenase (NADP+)
VRVVPILGARRVTHLEDNLAALDITLSAAHPRTLREVSAVYPPQLRSDARH